MSVAFFDLDRTLLDCNSGRLWITAEWREGRIGVRDVAWAAWWLARYSVGHEQGLDEVFRTAVATLRGTEEAVLDERVRAWFDREVAHRLRPGAVAALERHRERGDRLVLATSGSVYAARRAIEVFGLDDQVATEFEVVDSRFTGEVSKMAVGAAKATQVRRWADSRGVDLQDCAFYTDSATDLALLELVGEPVVVHPDRALAAVAAERGWPVLSW